MKEQKKNFKSQLHLACGNDDLRPVMQHIYFDSGFAVATDAHMLVKQSLKEHGFNPEEIDHMNGKFLHKDAFKMILKANYVSVDKKGFNCRLQKELNKMSIPFIIPFSDFDGKFPNYEPLIPKKSDIMPIEEIGLSLAFLERLIKLRLGDTNRGHFRFHGDKKAVILSTTENESDETIMIMPILLR